MPEIERSVGQAFSTYSSLPLDTQIFVATILLMAIYFHYAFTHQAVHHGPTILTTFGIFATFFGVAQGLAHFDTSNIQASVPSLLGGLKTAFWASVVGVGAALSLKLRDYIWGPNRVTSDLQQGEEITAADLANHLQGIQRALVGGDDGSLISQIKLSRQDTNDRLDALRAAQTEALSKLSELGSKALVEALRDVIKDFNLKITEQFGDNFKELNAAVGRLLSWQEQYKNFIETTALQIDNATRLMSKATSDYSTLVEQSSQFSKIAEDLGTTVINFRDDKEQLETVSEALAKLLQSASGSLPDVEKKVLQLTTELTRAVTENQKTIGTALTESARHVSDLTGKTKEQVAILDKALSDQLTESLEGLGNQLAALSEKFARDYGPLTDKLNRVLDIARQTA